MADARKWYNYLSKRYPDKSLLDNQPNSYPRKLSLDQFAVGRVQQDVGDTSEDATTAAVEGLLIHAYEDLAIGQDDRYTGERLLARKVYDNYTAKGTQYTKGPDLRTPLPPFKTINKAVLANLLDAQRGLPYGARAVIISQLGITNVVAPDALPAPTNAPAVAAPEAHVSPQ